MRVNRIFALLFSVVLINSCASIPKEAPELSQEIGQRVAAIQQSHMNLVSRFIELKRQEVNRIFEEEWIPAYAESFFSQPQVADYWQTLVSEDDKEERLQFLIQLGPRMLEEIRNKRAEFMAPLDELEAEIKNRLQNEYVQILSANNTLTSFLVSSSKVVQNRQRYLNMFGIEQSAIEGFIDEADEQSQKIIETIRKANIE